MNTEFYYDDFLNEALESSKDLTKIIILTGYANGKSPLEKKLTQINTNKNVRIHSVDVNNIRIVNDEEVKTRFYIEFLTGNNKPIRISPSNTMILFRRSVILNTNSQIIANKFEELNFFCINPIQSMNICENKYLTYLRFVNSKVATPRTTLISNLKNFDTCFEAIGGKFPIVMKILNGTHGMGVSIIESESSFKSVYQTLMVALNKPNIEILLQELIPADYDLRIHVIKNQSKILKDPETSDYYEIIGAMRRNKIENDFRTNFSLGGTIDIVDDKILTDEIRTLAINACKAVEAFWCGVDIIIDKETGKPYVLEVNTSPGIKGISTVDNDTPKKLYDWLTNKQNWISNVTSIGYLEKIKLTGVGEFVAKFDTGNGSLCSSLIAEDIKVDGDKVYWKIGKKKFVKKFRKFIEPTVGFETHKRPVVKLNVIFLGKKYKGVEFALTDRLSKSTPILINRKFMRLLGVTIDSSSMFKFGEFVNKDGSMYSPKASLNDPYGGVLLDLDDDEKDLSI